MDKRVKYGSIALIGYLLSPLSPWNDFFINIPIAYGLAFLIGFYKRELFYPSLIVFYWITNFVGLFFLHYSGSRFFLNKNKYTTTKIMLDIMVSLIITILLIILIKIGWLRFPTEYLKTAF